MKYYDEIKDLKNELWMYIDDICDDDICCDDDACYCKEED